MAVCTVLCQKGQAINANLSQLKMTTLLEGERHQRSGGTHRTHTHRGHGYNPWTGIPHPFVRSPSSPQRAGRVRGNFLAKDHSVGVPGEKRAYSSCAELIAIHVFVSTPRGGWPGVPGQGRSENFLFASEPLALWKKSDFLNLRHPPAVVATMGGMIDQPPQNNRSLTRFASRSRSFRRRLSEIVFSDTHVRAGDEHTESDYDNCRCFVFARHSLTAPARRREPDGR